MFGADQRGQAIQIGAVILFSFVVIGFSLYQATVVPDQNARVEFNHNQEVQGDLLELRGGVLSAGASGSGTATTVQLGAQYPARIFAVNPGAPSGSLRTVDPGGGSTLSIANAEAENPETADFWSGTGTPREYTTHGFVYRPNYNEYREAPETVYENTVVYNRAPGGVSVQTGQRLVSGRELDLTVLLGSYQADQSGSVSVDVSAPANEPRTVAVRANGDPINVTAPTSLPESVWIDVLEPEFVANGGYVDGATVSVRGGILSFELRQTDGAGDRITYELRIPAAGIGTDVPDPAPAYVTTVSGDGTSIPEGGTQQVVAEVRNEFNGPESGVNTCAGSTISGSSSGSIQSPTTATTDEEGRVSFVYEAPADVDQTRTATVTVGFGPDGCDGSGNPEPSAPAEAVAEFEIDVLNADGSSGGGGTGDAPSIDSFTASAQNSDKIRIDASFSDPGGDGNSLRDVTITVENTNTDSVVYSDTVALSGDSDSLDNYQTDKLSDGTEYRVTLVVSDTADNTDSDQRLANT